MTAEPNGTRSIAPHTPADRDEEAQLSEGHSTLHSSGGQSNWHLCSTHERKSNTILHSNYTYIPIEIQTAGGS